MQNLKFLNSREVKKINEMLFDNFGYSLKENYVYLQNEKYRVFLINRNISKINLKNLRIDRIGLYYAEINKSEVRLSKEGAQLFYQEAIKNKQKLKNILNLDENEVKEYFEGHDLKKDLGEDNRFILLKFKESILGCCKYKEQKIINFLPKIHRGTVII